MKNKLITLGIFIGPAIAIIYLILLLFAMSGIDVTFGINPSNFGILLFIILIGTSFFSFILNIYAFIAIRGDNRKFLKRYWIPLFYYVGILIFAFASLSKHRIGPEGGFYTMALFFGSLICLGIAIPLAIFIIIVHKIIKRLSNKRREPFEVFKEKIKTENHEKEK